MKRYWLVLLTLGLITVFTTSALAVDLKFSGSFYAAGLYQDQTTVKKNSGSDGPSTAFYFQRLRVRTDFIAAPGLSLVTRFDAMERVWGAQRSDVPLVTTNFADSAGTRAENENIAFDWAYIAYQSPIGTFEAGYRQKGTWGTDFADNAIPTGSIYWGNYFAPAKLFVWALVSKQKENSLTAINAATTTDLDNAEYMIGANYYGIKNVEFGFFYDYLRYAAGKKGWQGWAWNGSAWVWADYGYMSVGHLVEGYFKAKFGPVRVEAEVDYAFGDYVKYEGLHPGYSDMKLSNLQAYIKAVATFGPAYVGGIAAYVAGDDPGTADKYEGGYINGGREFNPALILFNSDRSDWAGTIAGYDASTIGGPMRNAWFFQVLAGVRPISNLDIMATVSYATADKKPTQAWLNNAYGTEVDLVATYKITNNLSYMLGGGYLFTGNYFKGTNDNNEIRNDYLLINKLTLTF